MSVTIDGGTGSVALTATASGASLGTTLIVPAGSAAAPSVVATGDTNTGVFFPAADTVALATGGTERVRVPSSGGVQAVTTISVGNATPSTSGAGITFPATQSASSDANTLDDYEEGTWTVGLTPENGSFTSITWLNQQGRYTKIGNTVIVWFTVYTNAITVGTASGLLQISGLPFAVSTQIDGNRSAGALSNVRDWAAGNNPETVGNVGGGTTLYLWKRTSAGGVQTRVQVSDLGTGSISNSMHCCYVYQAA